MVRRSDGRVKNTVCAVARDGAPAKNRNRLQ
jgi:hypothetical protein